MSQQLPFFTIAIPSLNRIESLKMVISSIRLQTFRNYELVIVDDASNDPIADYISSLKDERIRFLKNRKRNGFKSVLTKCLFESRGKYVMTLGNDDMLCTNKFLENIYKKLVKKEIGIAKPMLVYYYRDISQPSFSTQTIKKDKYVPPETNAEILEFVDSFGLTHIAGTIYNRSLISRYDLIDNELIPFLKILVKSIKKKGLLVFADEYIATGISTSYLSLFSRKKDIYNTWFFVMQNIYSHYIDNNVVHTYIYKKMKEQIPFFVAIRSYVGVPEIIGLIRSYIAYDRRFIYDPLLYLFAGLSLVIPSKLFIVIRGLLYRRRVTQYIPPSKYSKLNYG